MASYFDPILGQRNLVQKDNPYHDEVGRFTTGDSAGSSGIKPNQSTEEAYSTNGVYTPAREAWHQKLADEAIAGKVPEGSKPELTMLGGGMAVGKTTMSNQIIGTNPNTVYVDADELKLFIPEYAGLKISNPDNTPGLVHEEASTITKLITAKAIAHKLNIVYDATSAGTGASKMVDAVGGKGEYSVHVLFADVPEALARQRAESRAADPTNKAGFGRRVHEDLLHMSHGLAAASFMRIKDSPNADSAQLFDTSGPIPQLIYGRSGHSNGVVYDQSKWAAYEAKAAGSVGMVRPTGHNYASEVKKVDKPLKKGQFWDNTDVHPSEKDVDDLVKLIAEEKSKLDKKK